VTTALAFLALAIAPFPGIRDLGLTAGLGLLCCLAATFLFLPPLLMRFDRGTGAFAPRAARAAAPRPPRKWKPVAALAVLAVALIGAPRARWEEDLRKFRMADNPPLALQERLQGVLGASLRPLAVEIPISDPDRLPLRWNKLAPLLRAEGVPAPDWQTPEPRLRAVLGSDTWRQETLRAASAAGLDPVALEGPLRALGEAAQDPKAPVTALQALLPKHEDEVQALTLPLKLDEAAQDRLSARLEGTGARLVGTRPLLQVVKAIAKDAIQEAVLLSLAAVLLIIAAFGRSWRFAALALAPLLASQAGVFGALGWSGEPLTFLSLTAIPIALGVSVDTAFNLLHRARHEPDAAARVARVNAVCAGTTLAGFGGLAFSSYRALRGVGIACLGGVALALLLTQWLLPALLKRWDLRSGK
jgi:predicted exporter